MSRVSEQDYQQGRARRQGGALLGALRLLGRWSAFRRRLSSRRALLRLALIPLTFLLAACGMGPRLATSADTLGGAALEEPGITISNGLGASIALNGPSVSVNNGALGVM